MDIVDQTKESYAGEKHDLESLPQFRSTGCSSIHIEPHFVYTLLTTDQRTYLHLHLMHLKFQGGYQCAGLFLAISGNPLAFH